MSRKFNRNVVLFLTVTMLVFMLFPTTLFAAGPKAKVKAMPKVHLKGMDVNGKMPNGLMKKAYLQGEEGPYIVSFSGPVEEAMKAQVENKGAKLVEYIPEFSFLALMTPEVASKVENLSFVEEVMIYQPAYKVNPSLKDEFGYAKTTEEVIVTIHTFGDSSVLDNEIINAHGKKMAHSKGKVAVKMHGNQLVKFAQNNAVKYVEEVATFELFNDIAKGYMDVDDMWSLGYDGAGQVVAVCDTGLDTGVNDSTMHLDFQGRIDAIYALGRSTADDPHGHGTHVAGSVLGDGARSNGQIKGMAPAAHLVFQSVLDSNDGLGGLPTNLNDLFAQAYTAGARIHTNSWGAAVNGDYDTSACEVDEYMWNQRDMIILYAASNDGPGAGTIGSPGTAKNTITVGATENYRPELSDPWGDNPAEIAEFSSRGWCEDGRIKPDIAAPGTWILSTKSTLAPDGHFWNTYDNYYAYMGGTSMATPLTAGAVATARQFMQTEWNHTPSAAMMKAAIINGATDMGYGLPSKDQGWGRVSLVDSLTSKEYNYEDETYSLATGQNQSFTYSLESCNLPLRVSLVWTDYPGSTTASKALVNDLDLKVTSPSGNVYYGNDFTSPFNNYYDRTNNVENVYFDIPEVGTYTVEVIGYNVPQGPQPFALFTSADFGTPSDLVPPTCNITAPTNGATVSETIVFSATASDNESVNRVEFYVDGIKVGTDTTSPYSINWATTNVVDGSHTLQAKAFDNINCPGLSNTITVTTDNGIHIGTLTETFTGYVNTCGTENKEFFIDVAAAGDIDLNLSWNEMANLDMFLYDPFGAEVARAKTGNNPETISFNATTPGQYKIRVYAEISDSDFILTAIYQGYIGRDTIAPTCDITAPSNGAIVSGTLNFSANATDNDSMDRVEFYIDGSLIGTDTISPYNVNWDTTTVSEGNHILQAKAYDASGNEGSSSIITVTVDQAFVTDTFTGFVDYTDQEFFIDVNAAGIIDLDLSWDNSADLDMVLYDPSGLDVARASTSNKPETISYSATTTGQYKIRVKAYSGSASFTLTATYPGQNNPGGGDTTAPTVSIIAPSNGATVSGTISFSANATDNESMERVEFYVDGSLIGTDTYSSYSINWDTTTVSNGSHTLQAKAYDAVGNEGTFSTITVTVDNQAPDTIPPTVSITDPFNGATVSGTISFSANATDDQSMDRVEFYDDGSLVGTDFASPYSYNWDTTTFSNGSHTLQAKAYDAAGNEGTSSTITVTVDNQVSASYVTDTFSGKVKTGQVKEYFINVTAAGTIDLSMNTSNCTIELYNPYGTRVATGTSSISYDAAVTGNYKITVTTTSNRFINFTLTATYPVMQ